MAPSPVMTTPPEDCLVFPTRKANSIWSIHNQRRAEQFIRDGRTTPAGLAKIAQPKASGEWDAALQRENVCSVPDGLVQALEETDGWLAFENWPATQKKQYLFWLESAKRQDTRQVRILAIVDKAKER